MKEHEVPVKNTSDDTPGTKERQPGCPDWCETHTDHPATDVVPAVSHHSRVIDTWTSRPGHGGHTEPTELAVAIEQWQDTGSTGPVEPGDSPSFALPTAHQFIQPADAARIAAAITSGLALLLN